MNNNKGFTLLEVIISVAILSMVSIPLLSYFSTSSQHNHNAKVEQGAIISAQDALEEVKTYTTNVSSYGSIVEYSEKDSTLDDWKLDSQVLMNDGSATAEDCISRETRINGVDYTILLKTTPVSRTDQNNTTTKKFFSRHWAYTGEGTSPTINGYYGNAIDSDGNTYTKSLNAVTGTEFKTYVNASMNSRRDCVAIETAEQAAAVESYFQNLIREHYAADHSITNPNWEYFECYVRDSIRKTYTVNITEDSTHKYLVESVVVNCHSEIKNGGTLPDYTYTMHTTKVKKSEVEKHGSNIFVMFNRPTLYTKYLTYTPTNWTYNWVKYASYGWDHNWNQMLRQEESTVVVDDSVVNALNFEDGNGIGVYFITQTKEEVVDKFNSLFGITASVVTNDDSELYKNTIKVVTKDNPSIEQVSIPNVYLASNLSKCFATNYTNWGGGVGISHTESVNRLAEINVVIRPTATLDDPSTNLYVSDSTYVGNEYYDQ